jgi:hypothetical protein
MNFAIHVNIEIVLECDDLSHESKERKDYFPFFGNHLHVFIPFGLRGDRKKSGDPPK